MYTKESMHSLVYGYQVTFIVQTARHDIIFKLKQTMLLFINYII